MLTVQGLIDAAKAAQGIPSNYRLARVLGVTELTVANWKHGRKAPDDGAALRLAAMAGLDPAQVLAAVHAARATDPTIAAAWASMAARLQQAGAAVLTVILSVLVSGSPDAQARARTGVLDPGAIPAAVVKNTHWRASLRPLAHFLGVLRRLAMPIGAPCCT